MDAADTKLCGDPEFARTWGIGSIAEIDVETLEDVAGFEADPGHAASSRNDMIPDPMPIMPARRWRRRRAVAHDDDRGVNPTPCRKRDHHASGPTKAKKMKKMKKPIKQLWQCKHCGKTGSWTQLQNKPGGTIFEAQVR